ncbi:MAG: FKBP-type peptidyl-prolyl cis-trans isomerase, partial [Patescibacteria group bacterium]
MKSFCSFLTLALMLVASLPAQPQPTASPATVSSPPTSYTKSEFLQTLGWHFGRQLALHEMEFTTDELSAFAAGLELARTRSQLPHPPEDIGPQADAYIRTRHQAAVAKIQAENAKTEQAFLNRLQQNRSISFTPSGLGYEITAKGSGPAPTTKDNIKVTYTGQFASGEVFDRSQEGITFSMSTAIPGWAEGLALIGVGGKIKLYVPSKLAYGAQGNPPLILPNTPLIFTVE